MQPILCGSQCRKVEAVSWKYLDVGLIVGDVLRSPQLSPQPLSPAISNFDTKTSRLFLSTYNRARLSLAVNRHSYAPLKK
jgi:hypothetical protein